MAKTITSSKINESEYNSNPSNIGQDELAPDGGYGWVVLTASFLANVVVDGVCFAFGIFYLEFLSYYGEDRSKTAWIGSVLNGTYMITAPLVAALANEFGCRQVSIIGAIWAAVAFFSSAFCGGVNSLILVYSILGGIGFGMMYLPSIIMVTFYFTKKRAFATGVATCGSGIGAFIFAPLCQKLIEVYGWKGTQWIVAGLVLNGIVFGALYRPISENEAKHEKNMHESDNDSTRHREKLQSNVDYRSTEHESVTLHHTSKCNYTTSICKDIRDSLIKSMDITILKNPVFDIYGLSCMLCMAGFFVPFTYLPDYCISLGFSKSQAAFLLSILGITNTVGRVLAGWLSDRSWTDCLLINNLALIIGGLATAACPFCNTYALLCVYSSVFGMCIAAFVSLRSIILVDLIGLERLTGSFGFIVLCQGIGSVVGSPFAGLLYDMTGSYNMSFYVAGAVIALAGFISLPLRKLLHCLQQ